MPNRWIMRHSNQAQEDQAAAQALAATTRLPHLHLHQDSKTLEWRIRHMNNNGSGNPIPHAIVASEAVHPKHARSDARATGGWWTLPVLAGASLHSVVLVVEEMPFRRSTKPDAGGASPFGAKTSWCTEIWSIAGKLFTSVAVNPAAAAEASGTSQACYASTFNHAATTQSSTDQELVCRERNWYVIR